MKLLESIMGFTGITYLKVGTMNDIKLSPVDEAKQKKIATAVKFGVMFLACAVIAPVVGLAITGIVGLGAFAAISFIGYNVAPVLALKVANAKYRALDAEKISHIKRVEQQAAANPIETAKQQSIAYKTRATKQLENITAYGTEVNNFEILTNDFSKKYPERAARYSLQLDTMRKVLASKNAKYKELIKNINLMDEQIEMLAADWKMSQALQKVNATGGLDSADPMDQIKADAAIEAVSNSISRAFAEMDSSVLADSVATIGSPMDKTERIANAPSPTLSNMDALEMKSIDLVGISTPTTGRISGNTKVNS